MDRFYIDRYIRHQSIHWFNQEELFRKNVLIVGMGAIGNELLKNMVLLGIGNITIIDFDKIEIHNLTRSVLFREEDIGKYKVQVAKERAKELNPDPRIKIQTFNDDFYQIVSLSFLEQFDVVFSAVDNFEARIRLHRLCFLNKVDFINAGIDSQYVNVEYFPYSNSNSKNHHLACFECNLSDKVYQNINKRYSCGWIEKTAINQKKIPTTIITSSIAASFMLSCFLRRDEFVDPTKIFIDTIHPNITKANLQKNRDCYFCSNWGNTQQKSWKEFLKGIQNLKDEITFFLNEPILISLRCEVCNKTELIWDLSRKFKDKDLICHACKNNRQPEVRDYIYKNEIQYIENLSFKYLYYFMNNLTVLVKKDD